MKLSIVVPCYNAETKIGPCLESLEKIDLPQESFEILFVDDSSTDGTLSLLEQRAAHRGNWRVVPLTANSGSPSRPRNVGTSKAVGEYVFFLDCDDEILPDALRQQLDLAEIENADIVRASLYTVERGRKPQLLNRVVDFRFSDSRTDKIAKIIRDQSTTNSSLIRRSLLIDNGIIWPEHLHMGEDTVFLNNVLSAAMNISYLDEPAIIYHKSIGFIRSTTQQYGARELASHLEVWESAEHTLSQVGLSYMAIRGHVALRMALESIYRFNRGDIDAGLFSKLSRLVHNNWDSISQRVFRPRIRETLEIVNSGNYEQFQQNIKQRLLIAGMDLKFISPAIPSLREHYDVKLDEWTGHDSHDEKQSQELLEWADVVFCEWLLGNAVWYARHKRAHQRLIVRMHRFELNARFGHEVDQTRVDCFISVSLHTSEDMIRTFGLDRTKVRIIPNYLDVKNYKTSNDPAKTRKLAMVGMLPKLKGYHRALELLHYLNTHGDYSLTVFGKGPLDLPWVYKNPVERTYYESCERYILDHNLTDKVTFSGWVDTKEALSDFGFVLSLSDLESFHVAPAEGFASGNQGVFLPWHGVDYVYPEDYIFEDVFGIRDYILENQDLDVFNENAKPGQDFVRERYSLETFITLVQEALEEV
ncbi:glycosyltransferase involved in cell wall biosynthesis [Paenarthrobacter nitroguajacolicus]|uniref:glycosyltransferase n=1 Tax=Paenarthrobacter TaxID=1742992 RepID=UPI002856B44A|nr:glycosyltransferase [Paenarthrobacter nitroguajacolicus]MDR6987951.1 glycosyltransferase involved in cell wall biosynthesis [Paenarthrobacter nitroguajacolicus]